MNAMQTSFDPIWKLIDFIPIEQFRIYMHISLKQQESKILIHVICNQFNFNRFFSLYDQDLHG